MTPEQQEQLQTLNNSVNLIPYVAGMGPTEPIDYWTYRPEVGKSFVCRDYVEDKAERLRQSGWNPLDLTVVLCWTEPVLPPPNDREYHAVLAVKVGGETWILDSRFDTVYQPANTPADYQWDRQQIAGTVEFRDAAAGVV